MQQAAAADSADIEAVEVPYLPHILACALMTGVMKVEVNEAGKDAQKAEDTIVSVS